MAKLRVVHYINQFFAQIGGEEKQIIRQRFVWAKSLDRVWH